MESDPSDPSDLKHARPTAAEWEELSKTQDLGCIDALRSLVEGDGMVELTDDSLANRAQSGVGVARALLEAVEALGIFSRKTRWSCGCCDEALSQQEAAEAVCAHCDEAFKDCPGEVVRSEVFVRSATRGRDAAWVLVLHGMNTRGEWQEKLSWLCANTYKRSLPVFIYKYGKIRPGVFLRWRQRQLAGNLARRMELLQSRHGSTGNPDVISHSLGTLLLGRVLLDHPGLKVGRLILTGSILRPDFDWELLLRRGQVEAVLNQCGGKDIWVPVAHLAIPNAGPSGVKGFTGRQVLQRLEPEFGHSSFFSEAHLEANYSEVWDLFLKRPTERLGELASRVGPAAWSPLPLTLREAIRLVVVTVAASIAGFLVTSTVIGAITLWLWAV